MGFKALEDKIRENAQKYYTDGSQDMTDAEFDAAVEELRKVNPDSEVLKTGWGYDPSADSTKGQKIQHKYGEVGSLDKFHNWKEADKNIINKPVVASLKLDGISIVLYYQSGYLVSAVTRGDGKVGIDVTDKVRYILSNTTHMSYNIDESFSGAIRGEALMSFDDFSLYKTLHPEAKNPRNSTAGIMNREYDENELKFVRIFVYKIVGEDISFADRFDAVKQSSINYDSTLKLLQQWFQDVVPYQIVTFNQETLLNQMQALKDKWYGVVPADGIVIADETIDVSVDDTSDVMKATYSYKSQAFKFPAEEKVATVEDVEWSLSKSRYLIPRVRIEPTELSGTTVTYSAGFNAEYIFKNNIGPGAKVKIMKSGEIIPDIQEIVEPSLIINKNVKCPACGSDPIWDGVHLKCSNDACPGAAMNDLLVWVTKLCPKDGVGETLLEKFFIEYYGNDVTVDKVMQSSPDSIYAALDGSQGIQKKLFAEIIHDIFNNCSFKLSDAIEALNIPRFGQKTAAKLASHPEIVQTALDVANGIRPEYDLISIFGDIGDANAASLIEHLGKFKRLNYVVDRCVNEKPECMVKVAITGKLSCKRSVFEEELKAHGFMPGNISKDTAFLITDDPNSNSEKNKKADKYGITKITESEFRRCYM